LHSSSQSTTPFHPNHTYQPDFVRYLHLDVLRCALCWLQLWMRNLGITPGSKGRPSLGTAATPASTSQAAAAAAATPAADGSIPAPAAADSAYAAATPAADGAAAGPSSSSEQQQQQQQQQQPDERASGLRAAAAAALAAAKEGALGGVVSNYNKVTLKETRRFAGKDIEVCFLVTQRSLSACVMCHVWSHCGLTKACCWWLWAQT
jgi:hypothetical protein